MKMNQKGGVPVWLIVIGAFFGVIFIGAAVLGIYLYGIYKTCVIYENELDAIYKVNQSVLSNSFYGPLQTAGLAEAKYKDAITKMARVSVEGWKGTTGGQAMSLWLQQTFPNIDPEIYKKMVDIGERGLGKFEKNQADLMDRGRSYKNFIGIEPRKTIAKTFGYPKINLDEILTPVTDESTDKSFKDKKRVKPEI